jgi:ABC-type amino acid transport system permease subunit
VVVVVVTVVAMSIARTSASMQSKSSSFALLATSRFLIMALPLLVSLVLPPPLIFCFDSLSKVNKGLRKHGHL